MITITKLYDKRLKFGSVGEKTRKRHDDYGEKHFSKNLPELSYHRHEMSVNFKTFS